MATAPTTMTVNFDALPVTTAALAILLGFEDRKPEPTHSILVDTKQPAPAPLLVTPRGWRRFLPGARHRAELAYRRRMHAWWDADGMTTVRIYVPRARLTPIDLKEANR